MSGTLAKDLYVPTSLNSPCLKNVAYKITSEPDRNCQTTCKSGYSDMFGSNSTAQQQTFETVKFNLCDFTLNI